MNVEEFKPFSVLSIDGGGIRGVFPAHVLHLLHERGGIDPRTHFDFFAGTSTGSIIAAALALGVAPGEIVELYRDKGRSIFGEKQKSGYPGQTLKLGFHSKYCKEGLRSELNAVFGDIRLGEVSVPLLLPAVDIGNGGIHVFKSSYSDAFSRDANVKLIDAVTASCSAPVFFDPEPVDEYLLCDGGLWANNPALAAVIDAQCRLGIDAESIHVLSLGTGHAKTVYRRSAKQKWGLLSAWGPLKFIGFLMSLQSQATSNYLQLLLDEKQLLRLDFESDNSLPLDDTSAVDSLISKADQSFTHQSHDILSFLNPRIDNANSQSKTHSTPTNHRAA